MVFSLSLYAALIIFGLGLIYRARAWFCQRIEPGEDGPSAGERLAAALKGILATIFSAKILTLLKILILDVILLRRVWRESFGRWLMHMTIFAGFMLLLLMHALDKHITAHLFSDYTSTLNPFLFLRNLFGALVILGLIIAAVRRLRSRDLRRLSGSKDVYAIVILAVIMLSGLFLEGTKIVSATKFEEMVEGYSDLEEEEEIQAVRALWAQKYGVVFEEPPEITAETLEQGAELNEYNCAPCHSRPQWAFLSYPVVAAISPVALSLTRAQVQDWLWYIHFLACFIGLAYLPFSKFFHVITSPLSLLVSGVTKEAEISPANRATRRALQLDACTRCGTCSLHCSVAPVFKQLKNAAILPSEKLVSLRGLAFDGRLSEAERLALSEANSICTRCYRCTTLCPVGIDLQDLWFGLQDGLERRGQPEAYPWAKQTTRQRAEKILDPARPLQPESDGFRAGLNLSAQASTFAHCFGCQTCTNVCPVVDNYDQAGQSLDLLPHQIMYSLGLGLKQEALAAGMVWDCLTCYQCQENCPQGVKVCDVLYELKNLAVTALKD